MAIKVGYQQRATYNAYEDSLVRAGAVMLEWPTWPRSGVFWSPGDPAKATPTSGMSVSVDPFIAQIGNYSFVLDAAEVVTFGASTASNRTDRIIARIYDEEYGDPTTGGAVEVLAQGAALPARSLVLYSVLIRANASTVAQGDIAALFDWTAGNGGVLRVGAVLDGDASSLPVGSLVTRPDGVVFRVDSAGKLRALADGRLSPVVRLVDNPEYPITGSGNRTDEIAGTYVAPAGERIAVDLNCLLTNAQFTTDNRGTVTLWWSSDGGATWVGDLRSGFSPTIFEYAGSASVTASGVIKASPTEKTYKFRTVFTARSAGGSAVTRLDRRSVTLTRLGA